MLNINVNPLKKLGEDLGRFSADRLGEVSRAALNEAGDNAYELAARNIMRGVSLTEAYIKRRLERSRASKGRNTYIITGPGGENTALSHYGAMVQTTNVNWPNSRINSPFGPWPGWTQRKSDSKQDGVSVEVRRGNRKTVGSSPQKAFIIPGGKFKDKEGNPLVFRGTGTPGRSMVEGRPGHPARKKPRQKLEVLYGPSVYQLFRVAIPQISDEIEEDLSNRIADYAERELQRITE